MQKLTLHDNVRKRMLTIAMQESSVEERRDAAAADYEIGSATNQQIISPGGESVRMCKTNN